MIDFAFDFFADPIGTLATGILESGEMFIPRRYRYTKTGTILATIIGIPAFALFLIAQLVHDVFYIVLMALRFLTFKKLVPDPDYTTFPRSVIRPVRYLHALGVCAGVAGAFFVGLNLDFTVGLALLGAMAFTAVIESYNWV